MKGEKGRLRWLCFGFPCIEYGLIEPDLQPQSTFFFRKVEFAYFLGGKVRYKRQLISFVPKLNPRIPLRTAKKLVPHTEIANSAVYHGESSRLQHFRVFPCPQQGELAKPL